jgi:dihydropteroate synthase
MRLRLGERVLDLEPVSPVLMGIVNTSPESFSDGRLFPDADAQVAHGLRLAAEGAEIVDVGGESGVTHLPGLAPAEETRRVVPVVEQLAAAGVVVSVDTWKAPVARAALAAGATLVNDASGLHDPRLASVCAEHDAALVLTHTRAAPKVKAFPRYDDVVADVRARLAELLSDVERCGVARARTVVDPGLDLAKTPAQSLELLRRLDELRPLDRPILLAASRKDFVGALTGRSPAGRLAGTLAALEAGVDGGATILRVHDVRAAADFLAVRAALRADAAVDPDLHLADHLRREGAPTADAHT